jgi:SAM-dependent methyltransferase
MHLRNSISETPDLPFPPLELLQRVGRIDKPGVTAEYEAIGHACRARLDRFLPGDWSWDGKRILDFGCGAGRTLRHFLVEATVAEFYGCDIDTRSIEWLSAHLSPPFHVFESGERATLPQPDGFFDLVYAFSVFTHLSDNWAAWLLELRRVLKPDGLLFATFLNESHWEEMGQGEWDENRVGMNVIKTWNPWDAGGPMVFHSEWWIREHWGRAFEILAIERRDPDEAEGQSATLLRRGHESVGRAEVERPGDDPRELMAVLRNIDQVHREAKDLFAQLSAVTASHEQLAQKTEALETEVGRLREELTRVSTSRSWRMTAPLRVSAAILRRPRT